jgi:hypothetical protein
MPKPSLPRHEPIHRIRTASRDEPAEHRRTESLPFLVRAVTGLGDIKRAVQVRHEAYLRHIPQFAAALTDPEEADLDDGSLVLLAESKLDQAPIGTMRIQSNLHQPLCLESSIYLPQRFRSARLAEATRLAVPSGGDSQLVKYMLFKAFYLFCQARGIDWMVIACRSPVDRMYDRLLFEDVYPGMGYVPLQHAGGLPHRIMALEIATARDKWSAANHPLLDFVVGTHHPDLQLDLQRGGVRQEPGEPIQLIQTTGEPQGRSL